jgi:DNA/RNA-binding domain of Phe-tRNA-synthetase-like protein
MQQLPWSVPLGLVNVPNVDVQALARVIGDGQGKLQENREIVSRRMKAYDDFFAGNGFRSPLGFQLEQVQRKGLPPGSPLVQALLLAEMSTGILMGAQDSAAIRGELVYDLAGAGETFQGMRVQVQCRQNEIVLRDAEGIIASLFQGPDYRTRLSKSSRNIVFFIFSVPGISASELQQGVDTVRHIFLDSCPEFQAQIYERDSQP